MLLAFIRLSKLCIIIFVLSSCILVRNDKFGKENNKERIKLGLPIIKDNWTLKQGSMYDGAFFYPGPKDNALWFTNSRTKDKTLPYYAYKTIYFTGDTLVAECDTYLNPYSRLNKKSTTPKNSNADTLDPPLDKYNALSIIYVYKQLHLDVKDLSTYSLGFNYVINGVKEGFAIRKILNSQQAEAILESWHVERLNY